MGIVDKAKQAAITATVTKALDYLEKDPETNIPKIMEMVDKVTPDGWYAGQRNAIRHSIEAKDNWYQLILRMYQLIIVLHLHHLIPFTEKTLSDLFLLFLFIRRVQISLKDLVQPLHT